MSIFVEEKAKRCEDSVGVGLVNLSQVCEAYDVL